MNLQDTIVKRLSSTEPVSRFVLRNYLNLCGFVISDRAMRLEIIRLRDKEGMLIVSSGKGYKLATSRKEFEAHIKFKRSYAMAILRECRLMKRNFIRSLKPQIF